MKIKYSIILIFSIYCMHGFCENIQIKPIDKLPEFKNVGGPAFGEPVKSYSGKGLVQYVSDSKMIINSKMYFLDSSCVPLITSDKIRTGSIVSYALNKQAHITNLTLVVKLAVIGRIDRIDTDAIICDDHYYKFSLYVTYHSFNAEKLGKYDFEKGCYVGLTFNKERKINSIWYLNGHYLY